MNDSSQTTNAEADAATVVGVACAGEFDRYLAALLAPHPRRQALLALAAFAAEIARVPWLVQEPAIGEIRLQWWRDALALPAPAQTGQPVADAVRAAVQTYALPISLLDGQIDAVSGSLHGSPPLGEEGLRCHLRQTHGALFALAGKVLGLEPGADADATCAAAGQAYGLTRLLLDLPRSAAAGRSDAATALLALAGVTADDLQPGTGNLKIEGLLASRGAEIRVSLAAARQFAAGLPRPVRPAFLPLALVGPYLRALERSGSRFLQQGADLGPLTRVGRLAGAHLFGRW